jgi:hypothetical protein
MATNWPNSVQTFTNPTASSALNSPSHADQHATVNDTVEALQNYAGLVFVKSVTIGSGVSSVTVTGAFDSRFDNYRIVIADPDASSGSGIAVQFGIGTSLASYYGYTWGYVYTGSALTNARSNSTSPWVVGYTSTSRNSLISIDVGSPYLTRYTQISVNSTGSSYQLVGGGSHASSTSYSHFTVYIGSGTMSGGTIRVYGYNNG